MTNKNLTRRQALARLGIAPATIYAMPAILSLSTPAKASGASKASNPTVPTPPTPPSQPSGPSGSPPKEAEDTPSDHCRESGVSHSTGRAVISQRDFQRAQDSVAAGYAKPLDQIWDGIQGGYSGRIVSVEFTGFRYRPRYRFRAISSSGRLETVVVSARTGKILRIVGC